MWFIGVEVEQETSAPPPKKILDPPLLYLTKSYNETIMVLDLTNSRSKELFDNVNIIRSFNT